MPAENANGDSDGGKYQISKLLWALLGAIAVGVVLLIAFNSDRMPFGRSLNRHPPQLIGLLLIVLATFGLVVFCVRYLVLSSSPMTPLAAGTASYTFTTNDRPPDTMHSAWQAGYQSHPIAPTALGHATQNPGTDGQYSSGQVYTGQQSAVPQTPPPEFELPPSYAEATKGLSTDVIK